MPIQSIAQQNSSVAKSTVYEAAPKSTEDNTNTKSVAAETIVKAIPKQDNYTKSEDSRNITYNNPKTLSADELKSINDQRTASFKSMIQSMLGTQAKTASASSLELTNQLMSKINVSAADAASATAAISEDGEWGVKAVSTRIMDMAVALSGGDTSKLETLRNAVKDGFKAAGAAWGSELPGISKDTYNEVMKRFDFWKENGSLDKYVYGGDTKPAAEME